jgi:DNA polymerase III sliding clamp (beta) subunit (PCNA family)
MSFEDKVIKISADSSSGSFSGEVPAAKNGEDLVIGFHCRYMIEALRNLPGDVVTVRIRMNSVESGAVIEDAKGSGFIDSIESDNSENGDVFKTLFYVMPRRMNK